MGLHGEVLAGLEQLDVSAAAVRYAVAAVAGDDQLAAVLDGHTTAAPGAAEERPAAADDRGRAYLRRIVVAGFRGVGEEARLELNPGPGLTLVVGRNGSGKSSFAEAVEFALTGDNARWRRRSRVWRDGWRNLHHGDAPRVAAEFVLAGQRGTTVVERRWRAGGDLDGAALSVRGPDGPTSLETLGWAQGLDLYRPFLPYSELGALVDDGPTALHDALAAVLGLDELTAAVKRLREARLARERAWREIAAAGQTLADELDRLDDDRARQAVTQLGARRPGFDLLAELVAGTGPADRSLELLRQLAGIPGPDLDRVREVAGDLTETLDAVADLAGSDAARDLEVADLLAAARRFHPAHGDEPCPVCGTGRLDAAWAEAATARERQLRAAAAAVQQAHRRVQAARRQLTDLLAPAPGYLERGGAVGVDVTAALAAYRTWVEVPQQPDERRQPGALLAAAEQLHTALAAVREQAGRLLREREDRWRPHALRLAGWLEEAVPARDATAVCVDLKAAEKALDGVLDQLRARRWTPIAAQARDIWELLRQRSNVSVDEVALAGSGVRRRVEVKVTVDGVEGAALGVMSQGELHALALSLFLPRATLPESPFRFVVLDDPVQSMDPARVDGLARVLETVAHDRQVVVFTHDDRLPEAIRRLGISARVLEVSRGPRSRVTVREAAAPWQRHLDDARALARSDGLPELVRRRTVPGFCRLALEAACLDVVRARELAAGRTHEQVDEQLRQAAKLLQLLGLTLLGDSGRAGEVYGWLNRFGAWAADAVRACNEGAHEGFAGDPADLVKDVGELIDRAVLPAARRSPAGRR